MYSSHNLIFKSSKNVVNFVKPKFASTLAFLQLSNGKDNWLTSESLSVLTAAKQLGHPITGIMIGNDTTSTSILSSKPQFVDNLLYSNNDELFNHSILSESLTSLLQKIINDGQFSHFIMANNDLGKNVLPRLGAKLNLQPISNIIKIKNDKTFYRPSFAGNIITELTTTPTTTTRSTTLLSISTSSFSELNLSKTDQGSSIQPVEELSIPPDFKTNVDLPKLIDNNTTTNPGIVNDLTTSKIVIAGGAGLQNKENFENLLFPLSQKLPDSAIGATRVAVDNGYCPNSWQIGQTGKTVAPNLYMAIGISGAIQHLAGMKNSKIIVSINKDLESPICQYSDYIICDDLFKVIPELTEKL